MKSKSAAPSCRTILRIIYEQSEVREAATASQPSEVAALLSDYVDADREHLIGLYVNARQQVIARQVISVGTLSASLVHPREVFKPAVMLNAAAVIVAHNHPSGQTSPSPEDRETTKRLQKAGELLGIPLLDHVIIGPGAEPFSFRAGGLL